MDLLRFGSKLGKSCFEHCSHQVGPNGKLLYRGPCSAEPSIFNGVEDDRYAFAMI